MQTRGQLGRQLPARSGPASASTPARARPRPGLARLAPAHAEGKLVWGTPKSHEQRSVPVPKFLAELLAAEVAGKDPD